MKFDLHIGKCQRTIKKPDFPNRPSNSASINQNRARGEREKGKSQSEKQAIQFKDLEKQIYRI